MRLGGICLLTAALALQACVFGHVTLRGDGGGPDRVVVDGGIDVTPPSDVTADARVDRVVPPDIAPDVAVDMGVDVAPDIELPDVQPDIVVPPDVPPCGGVGEPCCTGGGCAVGVCVGGTCRNDCGAAGQPCCPGLSCGSAGFCRAYGGETICMACGGFGQFCCLDTAGAHTVCREGSCGSTNFGPYCSGAPANTRGGSCTAGTCASNNLCTGLTSGVCAACGEPGLRCCISTCDPGLRCDDTGDIVFACHR